MAFQAYKPFDWLSGSQKPGQKYTAWANFGQGLPDFGAGNGPGSPYQKVEKAVPKLPRAIVKWLPQATSQGPTAPVGTPSSQSTDPRSEAIRRRLRGL